MFQQTYLLVDPPPLRLLGEARSPYGVIVSWLLFDLLLLLLLTVDVVVVLSMESLSGDVPGSSLLLILLRFEEISNDVYLKKKKKKMKNKIHDVYFYSTRSL